jgi:alkaline phosphatase D
MTDSSILIYFLIVTIFFVCSTYYPLLVQGTSIKLNITHGIASGDVTDSSAILWSRSSTQSQLHVQYDVDRKFLNPHSKTAVADVANDFAAHVKIDGLLPNSNYYYRAWFSGHPYLNTSIVSDTMEGSFKTAPDSSTNQTINFVTGGDLGGQNFCRRFDSGYSIFSIMRFLLPDFFIFNGDQVYVDDTSCTNNKRQFVVGWENIVGNLTSIVSESVDWNNLTELHERYRQHWEYNRNDIRLQDLLRNTSMYSVPDDHEVINNYGGGWSFLPGQFENRSGYQNLVKTGLDVFLNFSPMEIERDNQYSLYKFYNWGRYLDLYILDTRSYRSPNNAIDSLENHKTLLGQDQLKWLKENLVNSTSIWKIIVTSVPMTIPKCDEAGCDSWATDGNSNKTFVSERGNLLRFLDINNVENIVFISTDVHFPANIRISNDHDGDGDHLILYEFVTGPLSAEPFDALDLDPTLNATFLYNESRLFNFGHIQIREDPKDNKPHLIYGVRDENGVLRPNSSLDLVPR